MITEKNSAIQKPILYDGGGFDDIWGNGDGGGGDNLCEFTMVVQSTKHKDVHSFDAQFRSSGRYEITNLIDMGSALRIYCVSKTDKKVTYNILAFQKRFSVAYWKIRTAFWLKFSLKVYTGKGEMNDAETLFGTLIPDGDFQSTWESFVSDGSWDAVRWSVRELRMGFGDVLVLRKYIGAVLKEKIRRLRNPQNP